MAFYSFSKFLKNYDSKKSNWTSASKLILQKSYIRNEKAYVEEESAKSLAWRAHVPPWFRAYVITCFVSWLAGLLACSGSCAWRACLLIWLVCSRVYVPTYMCSNVLLAYVLAFWCAHLLCLLYLSIAKFPKIYQKFWKQKGGHLLKTKS